MNKNLSKVIMLRAKLRNKFLKKRNVESKTNYVKQHSLCFSLLKKMKREYYSNLDEKNYVITRHFGKSSKQSYPRKLSPMKK